MICRSSVPPIEAVVVGAGGLGIILAEAAVDAGARVADARFIAGPVVIGPLPTGAATFFFQ